MGGPRLDLGGVQPNQTRGLDSRLSFNLVYNAMAVASTSLPLKFCAQDCTYNNGKVQRSNIVKIFTSGFTPEFCLTNANKLPPPLTIEGFHCRTAT